MDRWEALRAELNAPAPWWRRCAVRAAALVALAATAATGFGAAVTAGRSGPTGAPPPAPAEVDAQAATGAPAAGTRVWPAPAGRVVDGWEIGQEGDVVAVADWTCTGRRTPAVARPATGEVWLFEEWSEKPARPVGVVAPGVTALGPAGCGRLAARRPDGGTDHLDLGP